MMELMEEREMRIIRFLISKDPLTFTELQEKTKEIPGLQSQTSLLKCLIHLEKIGIIKHKKKQKYFLNMHKSEKKYYSNFQIQILKLENKIKKLEKSRNVFDAGYLLLLQIFTEWYIPIVYDHTVDRYKKNSIQYIRQKNSINQYRSLIHNIISIMESKDKLKASNVITSIDMAHFKGKRFLKM